MRKERIAAYRNVFGEVNNKQKADIQRCAARARIPTGRLSDAVEPTLEIIANGAFYYVANSQGGRFLKEDVPESEQRDVVVLRVNYR